MSNSSPSSPPDTPDNSLSNPLNPLRARVIRRITLVAILTNASLALGQVVIGILTHAFSLVADAAHTFSDLVTDFMVLIAGHHSTEPADLDHPYGHGRIETITSLLLSASLIVVGTGFLWTSGMRLQSMEGQPALHPAALAMALFTLLAKEALFRFTLAAGRRLRAPLLEANAWHARSDAASSLVVAVGIGGSLAGYPFLEPLAAAVVGFLIVHMGIRLGWQASRELIDTGLPEAEIERLRQAIIVTPGVIGLHEFRSRRMANHVLCDAHIQVDPHITVSEGHYISEEVARAVRNANEEVSEVLVHIDTENDEPPPQDKPEASPAAALPTRHATAAALGALLDDLSGLGAERPQIQRFQMHYIDQGVEVEVFLTPSTHAGLADALKQRTASWLAAHPRYHKIIWYTHYAP
ncbi:cation diffusion facilitator transporter [Betaproteobacteria bacterium]|nr:cation diffusion facilitator transporter [Betaproteobacteria bacterium]GHT99581.1 cation diffusion facilitator transporter [Betaproteobacteria bacterium]GHU25558.1 cation diffusion facilitator transporter [Betaproteobacteria bacterium]